MDLPFKSKVDVPSSFDLDMNSSVSFFAGAGYKFLDRYSVEIRYSSPRPIFSGYEAMDVKYQKLSFVLGYSLWRIGRWSSDPGGREFKRCGCHQSRAHWPHGYLPKLIKEGLNAPVYCKRLTADLWKLIESCSTRVIRLLPTNLASPENTPPKKKNEARNHKYGTGKGKKGIQQLDCHRAILTIVQSI